MSATAPAPKGQAGWPDQAKRNRHSPLANALRSLRWAEKNVKRVEDRHRRDAAEAQVRLARASARVDYLKALAAADATSISDGGSA